MLERVFLGWDRPFLTRAVSWLLERQDELPGMCVVVPTAQSGRRLREALADAAGAVLSPRVVTPGSFLKSRDTEAAPDWIERVAWVEILENVTDWAAYEALFPAPPNDSGNWASGLAREMVMLRHSLQENGLLLSAAARKLRDTVEAERWDALGRLEDQVEKKLQSWGMKSRSRVLAEGLKIPSGISRIVLAGVAEMPPLVERALTAWPGQVEVLIGAPVGEADEFSATGKPHRKWSGRALSWPGGSVQVVADPRQQADEALRIIGEMATPSDEVALGSADTEVGDELARAFTRAGWVAFHPAAAAVSGGLPRWFRVWCEWVTDPTLATLADLFALPETGVLVAGRLAQKAKTLADLRNRWMVVRTDDLRRRIEAKNCRSEQDSQLAEELLKAASALESWRGSFLGENFTGPLERMLAVLSHSGEKAEESARAMVEWLAVAIPLTGRVKRGAGFWVELMLSEIPSPAPLPPAGRVLDVQGWLELFHEPGRHLVLCGMNDGKVPARSGGEPWLSEASREKLGLTMDADRAARDAFLYHAMLEARCDGGRVDVICGKSGAGGDALLPSRLLLAAGRDELPSRVKLLFKEVEPPEAGLRWHADWRWQPRAVEPPKRLNVTSLGDYLACPFRYYLKHAVKMQGSDLGRAEWNPRDFGTVAHEVLERWGRDEEARNSENSGAIHAWLSAELDRVVAEWFGKRVPLAVRIQAEALRQRFVWLTRVQAATRTDGWEIIDVERKVELPVGDALIVAKIDRIDRHRDSGRLRVLDYKTGKVESVDRAHRKKLGPASVLPRHLSRDCPAVYPGEDRGKSADFLWHNLQLPLYAAALVARSEPLPTPCYFTLSSTEAEVAIHEWTDFETADLEAAQACADWVAGRIAAGEFWPPAAKVAYDDYAILAAGRNFEEMLDSPVSAGGAMDSAKIKSVL
jgi:ATP-dependent helicase/nuclease subunit B